MAVELDYDSLMLEETLNQHITCLAKFGRGTAARMSVWNTIWSLGQNVSKAYDRC